MSELTEEHYDDWDFGDDVRTRLRLLERMIRDGVSTGLNMQHRVNTRERGPDAAMDP